MPHLDASALDTDPQGLEFLVDVLRVASAPKRTKAPSWGPAAAPCATPEPAPSAVVVEIERRPELPATPVLRLRRAG